MTELTKRIGDLDASPATKSEMEVPASKPAIFFPEQSAGGILRAIDSSIPGELTPLAVLLTLREAKSGRGIDKFAQLVEDVKERDLNYQSARETVTEAMLSGQLLAESSGTKLQDKKAAAYIQAFFETEVMEDALPHFVSFDDFGYAASDLVWHRTPTEWSINQIVPIKPGNLTFDLNDARTPLLLPAQPGGPLRPLKYRTAAYVTRPGYGLPITRSHGFAAAFYAALVRMTQKDWAALLEMYAQPLRVGYYDLNKLPGKEQQAMALEVLQTALESVGTDSWAMLPEGMRIDFIKDTAMGSSADSYERFARYRDELMTKRITGAVLVNGTGNTGSGGSLALGQVHNASFLRKLKATAAIIARAIRRYIVAPLIEANFPEGTAIPYVRFHFEEPEDLVAKMTATKIYVDMGGRVASDEVRDALGWRAPKGDEETLGGQPAEPAPAAPTKQENSARQATNRFAAEPSTTSSSADDGDELDDLMGGYLADDGYTRADARLNEQLLEAIGTASTAAELVEVLAKFAGEANVDEVRDHLGGLMLSARAAGEFGADIGGE